MAFTSSSSSGATATTNSNSDVQEMKGEHVVIFPFMAKGHTVPLLHLTTALADRGHRVTLVTTPGNASFIRGSLLRSEQPNVHLLLLPFPSLPPLPTGCESTDHLPSPDLYPAFLRATALLRQPFHHLLLRLCRSPSAVPPPLCLISDFFLGWTLPTCEQLGVPRLVFHGMGAFSMAVCKSLWLHRPHHRSASFPVPGIPSHVRFTLAEVPDTVRNAGNASGPVTQFLDEIAESDVRSWGVLVNSFEELEKDYVAPFESFYFAGARAWLAGPLSLLSDFPPAEENECLRWLDGREMGSVLYVSFGTQAHVPDEQLDEVAHGLAAGGCAFIWVVRSASWAPPEAAEKRWEGRGRIERGWVPQKGVLEHVAVGGFVSHCGWNSVLESVASGVPILAWPMIAEQHLNAKLLVEELGMGVRLNLESSNKVVGREVVCEGVQELMVGEEGRRARGRAAELRAAARAAVGEGGSSRRTLDELLDELRKTKKDSSGVCGEDMELEIEGEAREMDPTAQLEWQDGIQIV